MGNFDIIFTEQSFLTVNWITNFIIIQGLAFCYALGEKERFAEKLDQKTLSLLIIAGIVIVLLFSLISVYLIFQSLISIAGIEKNEKLQLALGLQMRVRMGAIFIYGIFPIILILYAKIFKWSANNTLQSYIDQDADMA